MDFAASNLLVYRCDICNVTCNSIQNYNEHMNGQLHLKQTRFRCNLCSIKFANQTLYDDHVKSDIHLYQALFQSTKKDVKPSDASQSTQKLPVGSNKTAKVIPPEAKSAGKPKTTEQSQSQTSKPFVPNFPCSSQKSQNSASSVASNSSKDSENLPCQSKTKAESAADEAHLQYYVNQGKNVQSIGEVYLERLADKNGRAEYYCKLCNCFIIGKEEKNGHLKNPRHCVEFDKKFNEKLEVDLGIKPKGEPVGENYLVVTTSDGPAAVVYHCTLCDCPVYDGAKDSHLRGRKHRFQHLQKIGPILFAKSRGPKYNLERELEKMQDDFNKEKTLKDPPTAPIEPTPPVVQKEQQTKAEAGFAKNSPITTQVTLFGTGEPAKQLRVSVCSLKPDGSPIEIAMRRTGEDGRTPSLLSDYPWAIGFYKIIFDTGEYFRTLSVGDVTFQSIQVDLIVTDTNQRYFMQVIGPHEYSIKRQVLLENTK